MKKRYEGYEKRKDVLLKKLIKNLLLYIYTEIPDYLGLGSLILTKSIIFTVFKSIILSNASKNIFITICT